MGGKKQKSDLGKALMRKQKKTSTTNTSDIQSSAGKYVSERDGGDAAVALASYLEGSSLDDFLASAVLANREFAAVKESIALVEEEEAFVPSVIEKGNVIPEMSFTEMKVPRRPEWDATTTGPELNRLEKEAFLSWRREIAILEQATDKLEVTPFEKNLEVWRQLWHVRERSDVMIQIVDARNPLFYRSKDLDTYANEGKYKRRTILLINKSDFLTPEQRLEWGVHFKKEGVEVIFFSAKEAQLEIDELAKQEKLGQLDTHEEKASDQEESDQVKDDDEDKAEATTETDQEAKSSIPALDAIHPVLSREELLEYLTKVADEVLELVGVRPRDKGLIKFGMVGFPNVGKSSVINALLGASTSSHTAQRVGVGATPGKTKHFQTLILSDKIMLCDCPGLVFPSFVNSKAEMYCCGVLPISQLRDHVGPCKLMCRRIPKLVFDRTYGIKVPMLKVARDTDPVDVYDVLEAYARNRGYTTTGKGGPDTSRAARDLLRDYVKGKLLYCHPPPHAMESDTFNPHALALLQFPALGEGEDASGALSDEDQRLEEEAESVPDFDTNVDDKPGMSKRLKRHGRKGRKGRDKNPYEDSDLPSGASVVHVNNGGKKKHRDRWGPAGKGVTQ